MRTLFALLAVVACALANPGILSSGYGLGGSGLSGLGSSLSYHQPIVTKQLIPVVTKQIVPIVTKQVVPVVTKQVIPVVQQQVRYKQVISSVGSGLGSYGSSKYCC